MKKCSKCKQEKLKKEFCVDRKNKDGLYSQCSACCKIRSDIWEKNNREKRATQNKEWKMMKHYGLTIEQYAQMLESQNNSCDICHIPFAAERKLAQSPMIDHNHVTGKVRSILCARCNTLLGMACENTTVLQDAIEYLNKHAC